MDTVSAADRLRALERQDKWYLSCGDGIIWAPPFPRALHLPGFWDEAQVHYHTFAPLFTVALVDGDGNEVPLSQFQRRWYPHKLVVRWRTAQGVELVEERYALTGGTFVSSWNAASVETLRDHALLRSQHLVAYTAQPSDTVDSVERAPDSRGVTWRRTVYDRHKVPLEVAATLRANVAQLDRAPRSAALRSEGAADLPSWMHTPFWERWQTAPPGNVTPELRLDGISDSGLVYVAVDVALAGAPGARVEFAIDLVPSLSQSAEGTRSGSGGARAPHQRSRDPASHWARFFDSYPRFACSDPYFSRYYDYRLYGLALNRLSGNSGNVRHPAIAEGIGYFHVPITYSAQCHMWETRWARSAEIAHGSLLNFLEHQRDDGSLPGRIYTNHMRGTDFYHANWGDAVLAVHTVHPNRSFLTAAYDGLSRYARWLDSTRDTERCGMYDVINHFETGQEYMSRYQAVCPDADAAGWHPTLRLKGVDVTVYTYQLKRSLAQMALMLDRSDQAESWTREADRIGVALTEVMWDTEAHLFSDVDPRTMRRTGAKAAVCFYPLLTDLLDDAKVAALVDHLEDPQEFNTAYPVPSSSVDDPYFNAFAEWKGKRHNCPWNGRTWPMTNSHVVAGLLHQWQLGRRNVGATAARIFTRFVRMMFLHGDVHLPNCYEHYNPFTGAPSLYRGIDDYQHSWVLDLLIRGVAGLEPRMNGILVDPLPLDLERVELQGAQIAGHSVDMSREKEHITVTVDGAAYETELGRPLEIDCD